jgi:hypothetical protein
VAGLGCIGAQNFRNKKADFSRIFGPCHMTYGKGGILMNFWVPRSWKLAYKWLRYEYFNVSILV